MFFSKFLNASLCVLFTTILSYVVILITGNLSGMFPPCLYSIDEQV